MSPVELSRIEYQARQLRARVLADMIRGLFRRTPRATVAAGARTA